MDFHINICVLVCDCYFELIIFVIILFGTQQVVSEHMVVLGKGGKVTKVVRFLSQLERERSACT